MKKLFIVLLMMLFACPTYAAWTVAGEMWDSFAWASNQELLIFKITATDGDGSSSGTYSIETLLDANTAYSSVEVDQIMERMKGGFVVAVKYEPDATLTPATEATITIYDEILGKAAEFTVATANTAETYIPGDTVPVKYFQYASTTMTSGDKAYIYVWILK